MAPRRLHEEKEFKEGKIDLNLLDLNPTPSLRSPQQIRRRRRRNIEITEVDWERVQSRFEADMNAVGAAEERQMEILNRQTKKLKIGRKRMQKRRPSHRPFPI